MIYMAAVLFAAYFNVLLCAFFGKLNFTIAAMIIAFIYTIVFVAFVALSKDEPKDEPRDSSKRCQCSTAQGTTIILPSSMFTNQGQYQSNQNQVQDKELDDTSPLDDVTFDHIKNPNESLMDAAPNIKNVGNIEMIANKVYF